MGPWCWMCESVCRLNFADLTSLSGNLLGKQDANRLQTGCQVGIKQFNSIWFYVINSHHMSILCPFLVVSWILDPMDSILGISGPLPRRPGFLAYSWAVTRQATPRPLSCSIDLWAGFFNHDWYISFWICDLWFNDLFFLTYRNATPGKHGQGSIWEGLIVSRFIFYCGRFL